MLEGGLHAALPRAEAGLEVLQPLLLPGVEEGGADTVAAADSRHVGIGLESLHDNGELLLGGPPSMSCHALPPS